jgi:hypothetical protein
VLRQPLRVLLVLALIALVTIAVWYSVSRSGARGRFAAVVAVVAFVAADVIVIIMFR